MRNACRKTVISCYAQLTTPLLGHDISQKIIEKTCFFSIIFVINAHFSNAAGLNFAKIEVLQSQFCILI